MNYLNTKPMLYGITRHEVKDQMELLEDYPARVAQLLIEDRIDLGLIPVAATTRLSEWHIVSDYCIGCDGPVASVAIFSELPLSQITTIYMDYQSRTSVNLARILMKDYWKQEVEWVNAGGEDFRNKIRGAVGGVVIGDRALEQRLISPYIYDLGAAWKAFTGLPFVFAAWIANKPLPASFIQAFNEANRQGLEHLDEVIRENPYTAYDLGNYYRENISYILDDRKKEGIQVFLSRLHEVEGLYSGSR